MADRSDSERRRRPIPPARRRRSLRRGDGVFDGGGDRPHWGGATERPAGDPQMIGVNRAYMSHRAGRGLPMKGKPKVAPEVVRRFAALRRRSNRKR